MRVACRVAARAATAPQRDTQLAIGDGPLTRPSSSPLWSHAGPRPWSRVVQDHQVHGPGPPWTMVLDSPVLSPWTTPDHVPVHGLGGPDHQCWNYSTPKAERKFNIRTGGSTPEINYRRPFRSCRLENKYRGVVAFFPPRKRKTHALCFSVCPGINHSDASSPRPLLGPHTWRAAGHKLSGRPTLCGLRAQAARWP